MGQVKRLREKLLLLPRDFKATHKDFKVIGVFNPGAVEKEDEIILLCRIAETIKEKKGDWMPSPRVIFESDRPAFKVDWFEQKYQQGDPRKVYLDAGKIRLSFISHLRCVRLSKDGFEVKSIATKPALFPCDEREEFGIEDPRITKIGDTYYITYVGVGTLTGISTFLASTKDFKSFARHGIIFPALNKDVVLFPQKIQGKYLALHRPVPGFYFSNPVIATAVSPDTLHWGDTRCLFGPAQTGWDSKKIGAGPPPIKTREGWLIIYHGVQSRGNDRVGIYCAGAALLDLANPLKVLARSEEPILMPEQKYEKKGFVDNVIFPTGIVQNSKETILLFCGVADRGVSVIELSIREILESLLS
ncbi:glycoside hydrolase family 130 protein [Candidatus Riflebacteria bacterium]